MFPLFFFTYGDDPNAVALAPAQEGLRFPLATTEPLAQMMAKKLWEPGPLKIRRFVCAEDLVTYAEGLSEVGVTTVFLEAGDERYLIPLDKFLEPLRGQASRDLVAGQN